MTLPTRSEPVTGRDFPLRVGRGGDHRKLHAPRESSLPLGKVDEVETDPINSKF